MIEHQLRPTFILYDGECPFCSRYADYARLKTCFPDLILISARDDTPERQAAIAAGFDLNRVMLLHHAGQWYAGHSAIANATAGSNGLSPAVLGLVFGNHAIGRSLYAGLVSLRLFYLRLAGKGRINN